MTANSNGSVCLDCGMCCNGTFLDYAAVTGEEATVLEPLGLPVKVIDGLGLRIQLPCRKFDGCCTIYADRPAVCRNFQCRLLKSLDKRRIEAGYALQRIQLLKALKAELQQVIPDQKEKSYFREVRDFVLDIEKGSPEYRREHAKTLMIGTRFMNLINEDFFHMQDDADDRTESVSP